jgi:hypothetical protein
MQYTTITYVGKTPTILSGIKDSESAQEVEKSDLIMSRRSLNGVIKRAKEYLSLNNLGGN